MPRSTQSRPLSPCGPEGAHAIRPTNCPSPNCQVSVSIITYQHAGYIRECLDSVLMQETAFPFEILLGEDDSTDGTREICREYAEKHPDIIRLFLHKREDNLEIHGRATGRRNLVNNLQQARGKYIALLDGDDYWTDPTKLQQQFDVLENDPEAAGVFHDCLEVDETKGTKRARIGEREIPQFWDIRSILEEWVIPTSAMFFRNEIEWSSLPEWFFDVLQADVAMGLFVAENGPWQYLGRLMSVRRIHPGAMWIGVEPKIRNQMEMVKFYEILEGVPKYSYIRSTVASCRRMRLRRWAAAEAREGRIGSSLRHFLASIGPQNRRASRYLSPVGYFRALMSPLKHGKQIP